MKMLHKAVLVTFLLAFCALSVSGCNTVRGLGQDVEKVGSEIEEAAEEKKKY